MRWSFSRATLAAREWVRAPAEKTAIPDPIDFASMVPDEELFPVEPFRVVLDEALKQQGKKLLQYGPAPGYPPLRAYIAERLARRGVRTTSRQRSRGQRFATSARPNLPHVARSGRSRRPREPDLHDRLAVARRNYQAEIDEVPMTARGMDLDVLEATLARSRPKFLFTMPTFHNPTGITMDLASRARLIAIAGSRGVPVVEDDFDSELRFDGEALPPLKALDDNDGVIPIGTFSKGLFPGLRLGWIVAPPDVFDALARAKLISDYHTSLLLQAAVLTFCSRGHYDTHLERLAGIYRDKSRTLVRCTRTVFPRRRHPGPSPKAGSRFGSRCPKRSPPTRCSRRPPTKGWCSPPAHISLPVGKDDDFSACRFHESRSAESKKA